MDGFDRTLGRVGRIVAYGALGAVGTAAVALALLNVTQPVQGAIYGTVYLRVGPSEATETALLTHFLSVGLVATAVPMLVGDYLSDGLEHRRALGAGIGAMALALAGFLAVALAGLAAFLTALGALLAAAVGVPVLLRYRYEVRSGGLVAFVGGIPVLLLLVVAVGFGLGWGWGYVVTAQEVPAGGANGDPVMFDDAPAFEADLFADCEMDPEGRRTCHLYLRGYDHERSAARFMARHGVRCPYGNARPGDGGAFLARHDGAYYRVTCSPHGD